MIESAPPLYRNPPPVFLRAMAITNSKESIKNWVAPNMIIGLKLPLRPQFKGQFNELMWFHLLGYEFTDSELLTLWCLNTVYKEGKGLSESAFYHYGVDIDQLTPKEMISLIIINRSPSRYENDPESLGKGAEYYLIKYNELYGGDRNQPKPPDSQK